MDKNSLILDIKNELNSIKKQIDVTLAKLAVLESMVELDKLEIRNEELEVLKNVSDTEPIDVLMTEEKRVEQELEVVIDSEAKSDIEPKVELEHDSEKEEVIPNSETPAAFRNLMSVISLGDKFRLRHELFSDSDDLFRETIDILNTLEDFEKAVEFLDEKFNWDSEDATVLYFYEIIKPKF